jgi:multiple sugar transport system ATP-binding protein
MAGEKADVIERKVSKAATTLNLTDYLDRKPRQLSGGQRQRVAIGRAIVRQPKVFLFDEPLSNLDAALRGQMRIELSKLHEDLNATMIYVTHDQIEAMTMADKIVVLQAGKVEQVGSPLELYHHPANLFVAGFIGSPRMNFLPATVAEAIGGGTNVALASGQRIVVPVEAGTARPGDSVTLGIRPEGLRPDPAGPITADVTLVERLGGLTLLHAKAPGDQDITVQIEGSDPTKAHDHIRLAVDPEATHLFDKAGQALPHLGRHPMAA